MSLFEKLVARTLGTKVPAEAPIPERPLDRGTGQASVAEKRSGSFDALEAEVAAHLRAARYARALAEVDAAMSSWAEHRFPGFLRGTVLQAWGRTIEARDTFLKIAGADESDPELLRRTTMALLHSGGFADAERWARMLVAVQPEQAGAHLLLGVILQATGRTRDAILRFERVLAIDPDDLDALRYLGWCKYATDDCASADALLRRAISLDPQRPALWVTLGTSKYRQGYLAEAIECFETAVRLEFEGADTAGGAADLALALMDESRFDEIFTLCARALPTQPSVQLHLTLGLSLLAAGRFDEGWPLFEARFFKEPLLSSRRVFPRPLWRGQEIEGKTILVAQEQGVGDLIQCVRYATALKTAGARVLLASSVGLEEFCSGFDGIDEVVGPGPLPHFDYYCHIMSLPGIFAGQDRVPVRIPYLNVDEARLVRWKTKLPTGSELKVGLVWAGNPEHGKDRERSIAVSVLKPLWEVTGVRFYSLQKGASAAEIARPGSDQPMVDLAGELNDYGDTAAAISCLDLIVSVDTSVAHLAGALGKPVWTLLPRAADWRWGRTADVTSWYPSMRLFRQARHLQWEDVIGTVRDALQRAALDRAALVTAKSDAGPADPRPLLGGSPLPARAWCAGASCFTQARHGLFQFLPDQDDESDAIGWHGDHLEPVLASLSRFVEPGHTIVEIGSGIGSHTLPLSREIGAEGHLIAIERRERVRRALRENLDVNRITNVSVLSLESSETRDPDHPLGRPGQVSSISVDELGLASLHLLKFNAGTDAADGIIGAAQTLWRLRPPVMVLAASRAEVAAAGIQLFETSYRCWIREIGLFDEHNFNRRKRDISGGKTVHLLLAVPEEAAADMALDEWTALS